MPDLLERLAAALGDRYAIEREVGRGGMAVVFLAEDLKQDADSPIGLPTVRAWRASWAGEDWRECPGMEKSSFDMIYRQPG